MLNARNRSGRPAPGRSCIVMTDFARKIFGTLRLGGTRNDLAALYRRLSWECRRKFGRVDRAILHSYLAGARMRKLQIGCGENPLEGWLNSDLYPRSPRVFHLDASRPFPFPDGAFDYVFSEHMIACLSYSEGSAMLAECHRVLKPGGTIRISTPNLSFLIDLCREEKSDLQRDYIAWSRDSFIPDAPCPSHSFVVNNFMRAWGHRFIYDEETLRGSLERAGFDPITRLDVSQSAHAALRNLENVSRMPDGFLRLETLTLEATKPPAPRRRPPASAAADPAAGPPAAAQPSARR